jgi:probable addiction module antidote protein
MTTEYALFDASSYLDSDEMIAEYLTACAEDENPDVLLAALADVAKARGMTHVAKAAGLGRESLYKALAPGAHPRFQTIQAVLRALNVTLSLHAPVAPKLAKAHRKTTAEERIGQQTKRLKRRPDAITPPARSSMFPDTLGLKVAAKKRKAKKTAAKAPKPATRHA